MAATARHIIVHGRVQGVGFRFFVQHLGRRLGVTGSVRNCPDATVEIVVEGDSRRVEQFVKEVGIGPAMARIEGLEIKDLDVSGLYRSFEIEGW